MRKLILPNSISLVFPSIAKNHKPTRMVGIDIDKKLIEIAQKNVRFYRDSRPDSSTQYPRRRKPRRCFPLTPGPTEAGSLGNEGEVASKFPNNVQFFAVNYVLDCDELLGTVTPEFDTIMCLSTTKWIHLNFGDEGLKRVFRRIYAQLRPGGTFILESQAFSTYRKKKKLTEQILHNFKNIKLKPENFPDFLIHEVGFSRSEVVALPAHPAKGFQRPLQVFTKMPPSVESGPLTTSVGGSTPATSEAPGGNSAFDEVSSVVQESEPEENQEMSAAKRRK